MTGEEKAAAIIGRIEIDCAGGHQDPGVLRRAEEEIIALAGGIEKERDQLRLDMEDADRTRERLAELLTGVANALKGPPGPLEMHDWSDLPALAADRARVVEALAKCDPVFDGECALCGCDIGDRFKDGPEKHPPDCPWRLARALLVAGVPRRVVLKSQCPECSQVIEVDLSSAWRGHADGCALAGAGKGG